MAWGDWRRWSPGLVITRRRLVVCVVAPLVVAWLWLPARPAPRFLFYSDYTLPAGVHLRDGDKFEYIVVGAGAGGCAVAARLALAGRRVLLLEAGPDPGILTRIPGLALALLGSSLDWQFQTVPNNKSCLASHGRQCRFARGKCVGGSTSINHMIYVRGNPHDFDDLNIPDWGWEDMKPYFLKFEGLQDVSNLPPSSTSYHNTTGPIRTSIFENCANPWYSRLIHGFHTLNFPYNPDVNAKSQIGVTQVYGYVHKNERMSAARGYLAQEGVKANLRLAKNTMCTRVIIDEDNVARGVYVTHGKLQKRLKVYATKEVILSAGTVGTAKLLMLSGIGPAKHLESVGIKVRADLPVGENMTDHNLAIIPVLVDRARGIAHDIHSLGNLALQGLEALMSGRGPLTSIGLTSVTAFANTRCYNYSRRWLDHQQPECDVPSLQVIHGFIDRNLIPFARDFVQHTLGLNDYVMDQFSRVNEQYAIVVLSPVVLQPHSQGYVRLASARHSDPALIFPNYLDDERDVEELLRSITIMEHLVESLGRFDARIYRVRLAQCPAYERDPTGYWRCYVRHLTYSGYHAVGTCVLGEVLDTRLRVRGVRRLRVGDASVLPRPPRGNSEAAVLAIGERLADFILQDN